MTAQDNSLLKDLDKLLVKVAKEKKASLKTASPGDGVEDGTSKPSTGEQMAKNKEEAGKHTEAKVDGGAKANPVGGSLEASTEGATAVSASGDKGGEGADLAVKNDAPNGPEGGIKSASIKELSDALRKVAAQVTAVEKTADAKGSEVSGDTKQATAQSSLDYFLVKCARSLSQVKSAAEGGMDDAGLADHASDQLLQALQSGEIGEEDAEKMLTEMAQQGAITEQDLIEAMQAMHGGQGGQAAPAAPEAAPVAPEAAPVAAPADVAPVADPGISDPGLEAKLAAAHIDADHPQYLEKLSSFYSAELDAGYAYCMKVAEAIMGDEAGAMVDPSLAPPIDPASAGAAPAGDPMVADDAALNPSDPAEQQALEKLLADMGLTLDDLKGLAAQKSSIPQDPSMDPKVAAFREKAMTAILRKTAQVHLAAVANAKVK